jgi:hypothetical protein
VQDVICLKYKWSTDIPNQITGRKSVQSPDLRGYFQGKMEGKQQCSNKTKPNEIKLVFYFCNSHLLKSLNLFYKNNINIKHME